LYTILEKYDHIDGRTAQVLAGMHILFLKAAAISRLEADNKEVSKNDLKWISTIDRELANLVVIFSPGGWTDDKDVDAFRMAVVAEVFTNAEIGLVLETAAGIPYRLYIPLNDRQGGKRIAVGYGFSYYEFGHPMSNRLNNEQWKAIVYGDNPNMAQYLPFWMQGKVRP
jgi:hypothetical protein